jgi:hypothetical protein
VVVVRQGVEVWLVVIVVEIVEGAVFVVDAGVKHSDDHTVSRVAARMHFSCVDV